MKRADAKRFHPTRSDIQYSITISLVILLETYFIRPTPASPHVQRTSAHSTGTSGATDEEGSPRHYVAPRNLLFFYALLSISRKPRSGYDLMREIEDKTEGAWRPGPGAVYPTLQKLTKQGYIRARRKSGEGPTQVPYEITPAGLRNIANAKKAMESSGERMRMMSSLFIDLMEPDDLVKFALNSFELEAGLVRTITDSDKGGLSDEDRLFVLRQYKLNLERELSRTTVSIGSLEARSERGDVKPAPTRGKP